MWWIPIKGVSTEMEPVFELPDWCRFSESETNRIVTHNTWGTAETE